MNHMIVKSLEDIIGTEAETKGETWASRRFVLKKDGVGFSMTNTVIEAGTENYFWYKNHIEAVYLIEGEGEIEKVETGEVWQLKPHTMYLLDQNDKHIVRVRKRMQMICVFNPPLVGTETHNEEGYYPLLTE